MRWIRCAHQHLHRPHEGLVALLPPFRGFWSLVLSIAALLLAVPPTVSRADDQTRDDPSDAPDGTFGKADVRKIVWTVGSGLATLTISVDASTYGAGERALIAIHVLLDGDLNGIADREIVATRNADGLQVDAGLRTLNAITSTNDCQQLDGSTAIGQVTVATSIANGMETFAFSFDPTLAFGAPAAFRWAVFGQAPPSGAAAGPWDIMPDAANPVPGAANPGDRRCGPGNGGLGVRVVNGVAFPDLVMAPPVAPAASADPTMTPPPPPPLLASPPAAASFSTSPTSLRVSKSGGFSYAFVATALSSGKIRLQSAAKVKIGSTRRLMKLAAKTFTASATGTAKVTFKLTRANLATLKRVKRLRFRVTATLGGRTFTSKLTLKSPKQT